MNPVQLFSQVYIYFFLYSSDIITSYYVAYVYIFMLFVYVIKLLLGTAVGRYPIRFILSECVSYLGERGAM